MVEVLFLFLVGIIVVVWSCLCSSSPCPTDHCKPLSNDILVEILKRLPAEDLLRYQLVCKQWNSLISTPYFHHMHINYGGAVPTIAVELINSFQKKLEIQFLDEKCHGVLGKIKNYIISSKNMKIEVVNKNNQLSGGSDLFIYPYLMFSYHGLILFREAFVHYTIFNPITREQFTFKYDGGIAAFFFHPFAKDYYALIWTEKNYVTEFKSLTLTSLLSNDLHSGKKLPISAPYVLPRLKPRPIIKSDVIYWMADGYSASASASCKTSIIIFDIKEEEFHLISHPEDIRCNNSLSFHDRHFNLHLFEKEDCVSICKFSLIVYDQPVTMHVWNLLEECRWSQRETIVLQIKLSPYWYPHVIEPIGTLNGQLIISYQDGGVFAYNLRLRTLRRLEDGSAKFVCIHTKTILSLKSLLPSPKRAPRFTRLSTTRPKRRRAPSKLTALR